MTAFVINVAIATVLTVALRAAKVSNGRDETVARDYLADSDDPRVEKDLAAFRRAQRRLREVVFEDEQRDVVERFLLVSSSEVYGTAERDPMDDGDLAVQHDLRLRELRGQAAHQRLGRVRQRLEARQAEEPAGALDRMDEPEDVAEDLLVIRVLLEPNQLEIDRIEMFARFRKKLAQKIVHDET